MSDEATARAPMTSSGATGSRRRRWLAWRTTARQQPPAEHGWLRWTLIWNGLILGTLAVCTVIALIDSSYPWSRRLLILAVVTSAAAWDLLVFVRGSVARNRPPIVDPESGEVRCATSLRPLWLTLAAIAVQFLFFAALIFLHPVFGFLAFVVFVQAFTELPLRWAAPTAAIELVGLVAWQSWLSGTPVWHNGVELLSLLITLAFSITLAAFIDAIINQSEERQRLIVELTSTREALVEREREAGILAERQRMAREIHDTLAQGFTSIVMHLEAADQFLPADQERVRHHLDQARATARDSLAEARRLVWALRPQPLEGASLPEALERVAQRWSEQSGVEVRTERRGEPRRLPPQVEVTTLRIAQESLANIQKHAQARHVVIALSYVADHLLLEICDDGVGFDLEQRRAQTAADERVEGGFGLTGMRQRVEALGGGMLIESAPDEGTSLTVELPAPPDGVLEPAPVSAASAGASAGEARYDD